MVITERNRPKEAEGQEPTASTAVFTPDHIITNKAMVRHLTDTLGVKRSDGSQYTEDGIESATGIKQRHYCTEIGAPPLDRSIIVPEMGTRVALSAVRGRKDWDRVDDIFASTSFPYKESLGKKIAENLRTSGIEVAHAQLDVYAECTSPVWILNYLKENESKFIGKNILMVASEYVSPIGDDIHATLPSDAATAVAFTYGEDLNVLGSAVHYFPEKKDLIRVSLIPEYEPPEGSLFICDAEQPSPEKRLCGEEEYGFYLRYGEMKGGQVRRWLVDPTTIPPIMDEAYEMAGITRDDIDWVIPHQANGKMIDYLGGFIGIDQEKIFSNIRNHGNSGSASTFLAFHEAVRQGFIRKGSKGLFLGFGLGMMAGAVFAEVN